MDINGSCRNSNHMLRWGLFVHSRLAQAVYETDGASSKHLPAGEVVFFFMLSTKGQKVPLHDCLSSGVSEAKPILAPLSRTYVNQRHFTKHRYQHLTAVVEITKDLVSVMWLGSLPCSIINSLYHAFLFIWSGQGQLTAITVFSTSKRVYATQ